MPTFSSAEKLQLRFALLASSSLCKYMGILIENSQSEDSSLDLSAALPCSISPLHSQVINLPVIGETHWHLSIKWHLIYALFMPHLCAQVSNYLSNIPSYVKIWKLSAVTHDTHSKHISGQEVTGDFQSLSHKKVSSRRLCDRRSCFLANW